MLPALSHGNSFHGKSYTTSINLWDFLILVQADPIPDIILVPAKWYLVTYKELFTREKICLSASFGQKPEVLIFFYYIFFKKFLKKLCKCENLQYKAHNFENISQYPIKVFPNWISCKSLRWGRRNIKVKVNFSWENCLNSTSNKVLSKFLLIMNWTQDISHWSHIQVFPSLKWTQDFLYQKLEF